MKYYCKDFRISFLKGNSIEVKVEKIKKLPRNLEYYYEDEDFKEGDEVYTQSLGPLKGLNGYYKITIIKNR